MLGTGERGRNAITKTRQIIASGGVANLMDIINLTALNIYGAISGKAVYTGALDLKQALAAACAVEDKKQGENQDE